MVVIKIIENVYMCTMFDNGLYLNSSVECKWSVVLFQFIYTEKTNIWLLTLAEHWSKSISKCR